MLISNTTGNPAKAIKGSIRLWKLWGQGRKQYLSADQTQSVYNTSPTDPMVLHVQMFPAVAGLTTWTAFVAVQLKYYVEFFDQNSLAVS